MKIFEKLKAEKQTEEQKPWAEYRTLLTRDDPKSAGRLSELLGLLGLTKKHVLFHRAVLLEAKMMAADVALLPQARADLAANEEKTRKLQAEYNAALAAVCRAQQAEPALLRRVIALSERESDLLHLRRRFPEVLGALSTEECGPFPDNPPAALRNLAKELGLPRLVSAEG